MHFFITCCPVAGLLVVVMQRLLIDYGGGVSLPHLLIVGKLALNAQQAFLTREAINAWLVSLMVGVRDAINVVMLRILWMWQFISFFPSYEEGFGVMRYSLLVGAAARRG